jgi:hypothetical protein
MRRHNAPFFRQSLTHLPVGVCPQHRDPDEWAHAILANATQWADNIHYERQCGALIETTRALATLLMHSDLDAPPLVKLPSYVVKVFLYLGLKAARKEVRTEYSTALRQIAALGPKKQAKRQRCMAGKPAFGTRNDAAAMQRSAHWRRGHFRQQPFGPFRADRKLIFVAPILVRADRLNEELPRPKVYELSLGCSRR